MKNIYIVMLLLAGITCSYAQPNIEGYEYWFNNDFANKTTTTVAPTQQLMVNQNILTTGLANGIHVFNFRSFDDERKYSAVISSFFYKMSVPQNNPNAEIIAYEYWVDNDYVSAVLVNTPAQQQVNVDELISMSTLTNGIHAFNIRFKDSRGLWSSTASEFFYKMPSTVLTSSNLVSYEYWLDNDYASAVRVNTSARQQVDVNELIPMSTLPNGIHVFNIRFKDDRGLWSSTTSEFFYKMAEQTVSNNLITHYRYWVDADFANAVNVALQTPVKQLSLIDNLDFTHIPKGEHTISFQFKDAMGMWSSVTTDVVTRASIPISVTQDGATLTANISGAEYQWLDCNSDFAIIEGETNQSFTATQNGSYAVEVTQYSSADTSACYAVTTVNILENTFAGEIIVYPNPTNGMVRVDLGKVMNEFTVRINDVSGKLISISSYKNTQTLELNLNGKPGMYLMTIISGNKKATINLIRN